VLKSSDINLSTQEQRYTFYPVHMIRDTSYTHMPTKHPKNGVIDTWIPLTMSPYTKLHFCTRHHIRLHEALNTREIQKQRS